MEIAEDVLKKVAETTGGEYFRATNNKSLRDIYARIDKLEKSKIQVNVFRNKYDRYPWIINSRRHFATDGDNFKINNITFKTIIL